MLSPNRALQKGYPTLVAESVDETGTDDVRPFSVGGSPGSRSVVRCQSSGAGTITSFSGNLEESHDGQTTWDTFIAFDFGASEIFEFDASPGVSYRFNPKTVSISGVVNILATLI